jgi:hypothetical protein
VADFVNLDDHGPAWLVEAKIWHRGYTLQARHAVNELDKAA